MYVDAIRAVAVDLYSRAVGFWTAVADYRGGTYISQWQAADARGALMRWAKSFPQIRGSFIGAKTRLELIAAAGDELERPVPIRETRNVWYWRHPSVSIVVHLVKTTKN